MYLFDFVAEQEQLSQSLQMTDVLDFLDVIVGQIKHLQQRHAFQTLNLHYFVVIKL